MAPPAPTHKEAARELLAEALTTGTGVRLRVRGVCMDPLLREGDWVWVVPAERLQPGFIVLARSKHDGELVCHRLLRRVEDGVELAGDRTFALEVLPGEQVLGVVQSAERGATRLRLAGRMWRLLGSALAHWHLAAYALRGGLVGRLVEAARQRFLHGVHRVSWWFGRAVPAGRPR